MSWLQGLAERVRLMFSRGNSESRFDRELQFHVDMEADRLVREEACTPEEARRRAIAMLGGIEHHREALRDGRGTSSIRGLSLDLKLGFRMMMKYPGLTVVGVLGMSVAVAIGALAFTAVNALTTKSLPMDEGDRVVAIRNIDAQTSDDAGRTVLHDLEVWREGLRGIEDLSAHRLVPANLVVGSAAPVSMLVAEMTASGFRLARTQPVMGRYLRPDDEQPGAPDVVVIGHDIWQDRLGGRADVIGSLVQLGSTRYSVVGVMPEGFKFPYDNSIWTPLRLKALQYPRGAAPEIAAFARLAPGMSLDEVQLQLTTIGQRLAATYPETHRNIRPRIIPYTSVFFGSPGTAGLLHLGQIIVTLLLLVIGINVAVLVYARTASRTSEIAVRTALGASRRRIVMQLFSEALALSSVAALVGLVVARAVFQRVESMVRVSADGYLPYWMHLRITPVVALYVAGLAVLAAVIIGVIPGLKATRLNFSATIKGSTGQSIRLGKSWTALLVAQVAISVAALPIALAATDGLVRTMLDDFSTPETESYVLATPLLNIDGAASSREAQETRRLRYHSRLAELTRQLRELPGGSRNVVLMSHAPSAEDQVPVSAAMLTGDSIADSIQAGVPRFVGGRWVAISRVEAGFFASLAMRMLAGRNFEPADVVDGGRSVIVNHSFAQYFFSGGNALGRRIRQEPSGNDSVPGSWWEIVGIVDDFPPVRKGPGDIMGESDNSREPKLYLPLQPDSIYPLTLAVRAQGMAPTAMADRIRQIAMSVDPDLRFITIPTIKSALEKEKEAERMSLFGVFMVALSVVLLSAAGIYALMSFTVSRRQREIGIRSALGASRVRVLTGILSSAMRQVGLGIAIGALGTVPLAKLAGDSAKSGELVLTLIQVAGLMAIVGTLASAGPARRALRVQPTEALRSE